MDPTFAALLNEMKAKGWNDNMFGWMTGLSGDAWGKRALEIEKAVLDKNLTVAQRSQLQSAGSWEEAQKILLTFKPKTPTDPNAPTEGEQRDAMAYIREVLTEMGLESEADWAWSQIVEGVGQAQLLQMLRQRDAYKQRFAGLEILRQNGLPAISERDYINQERGLYQLMLAAGMPEEYRTQEYFARVIGKGKSVDEVKATIQNAYLAVTQAPPEVRQTFWDFYGTQGDQAFAALMLDPDQSQVALERMAQTAIVGGTARQYGFQVGRGFAEQVVSRGLTGEARRNFENVQRNRWLFDETISERQDLTTTQGIEAAFGMNADAEEAINRRVERRAADFGGAGQAVRTDRGIIGLGAARQ